MTLVLPIGTTQRDQRLEAHAAQGYLVLTLVDLISYTVGIVHGFHFAIMIGSEPFKIPETDFLPCHLSELASHIDDKIIVAVLLERLSLLNLDQCLIQKPRVGYLNTCGV